MTDIEKYYRSEKAKVLKNRVHQCMDDLISYARQFDELEMKEDGDWLRKIADKLDGWGYGGKMD